MESTTEACNGNVESREACEHEEALAGDDSSL